MMICTRLNHPGALFVDSKENVMSIGFLNFLGSAGGYDWSWAFVMQMFPLLAKATGVTIQLGVVSIFFGTIIGFVVALFKVSQVKILNIIGEIYTWVFRGIPLIVQLFIIYFGFSSAFGIDLTAKTAAVVGISICGGAYIAEIVRGAIQSIDKGQMEAALSLGMTRQMSMRLIIVPQTYRRLIPPLGNEFITLMKDTALASTITVTELLRTAQVYAGSTYKSFELYISAGVIYLFLTTIFTLALSYVEKRLAVKD